MDKKFYQFFGLVLVALVARYLMPAFFYNVFFLGTLIAYFRSKDEGFWLAFFLILCDGFFSFFGSYKVTFTMIPGLPGIEVTQFYIGLAFIKALKSKKEYTPFYANMFFVLLLYIVFLLVEGHVLGVSLNLQVQFRILKWLLPLTLFYSLPILMEEEGQFQDALKYLFPMAIVTLGAQVFSIMYSIEPIRYLGLATEPGEDFEVNERFTYRGFYNPAILLITMFGAMFYLSARKNPFPPIYLYLILIFNFFSAFLSATRGWIVAFGIMIFLFLLFASRIQFKHFNQLVIIGMIVIVGGLSIPIMRTQVNNAFDRLMTLNALAKGDLTAGGTLIRLSERGPKVMKRWKESPLTGLGYSDAYREHNDIHVGNQNLLLHAGIIGFSLIILFFIYFHVTLFLRSLNLPPDHNYKRALLVFACFFMGWFSLHSSSGQLFSLLPISGQAVIQAFYFTFGAVILKQSYSRKSRQDPDKPANGQTEETVYEESHTS